MRGAQGRDGADPRGQAQAIRTRSRSCAPSTTSTSSRRTRWRRPTSTSTSGRGSSTAQDKLLKTDPEKWKATYDAAVKVKAAKAGGRRHQERRRAACLDNVGCDRDRRPQPLAGPLRPVPRQPHDRARHDDRERRAALDPGRTSASPRRRWRGSSTPTCSPSAASCCWAAGSATCSATAGCSSPASRSSPSPRWPAGSSSSQALLIAARAVQGLGGAVVSAVALSLIMIAVHRAGRAREGDGRLRLRRGRRRQHRRAARRRAHRRAELALDLPGQPPDRRRRRARCRLRAAARRRTGQRRRPRSTSPARSP